MGRHEFWAHCGIIIYASNYNRGLWLKVAQTPKSRAASLFHGLGVRAVWPLVDLTDPRVCIPEAHWCQEGKNIYKLRSEMSPVLTGNLLQDDLGGWAQ